MAHVQPGQMHIAQEFAEPVRVFILARQSNMEGKGAIGHLEQLLANPATAETYEHLKDGDDRVRRDDVYIKCQPCHRAEGNGPQNMGYW